MEPTQGTDGDPSRDGDLERMTRDELLHEARRLRAGIRRHRDCSGHDLCWYHPQLWSLLPEPGAARPTVPEWPQFLQGCVRFRQSLDEQAAELPRTRERFGAGGAA